MRCIIFLNFSNAAQKLVSPEMEGTSPITAGNVIGLKWIKNILGKLLFAISKTTLWLISLPVILLLLLVFSLESVFNRFKRNKEDNIVSPVDTPQSPVSVIIPNYNGKDLLKQCLPSVVKAVANAPKGSELIIVDDASTDDSLALLAKEFPEVRVIHLSVNQGFGGACNTGISSASNRIVVLLNSDVIVKKGFLLTLTEHFTDKDVFAVQPKMLDWDGENINGGLNIPGLIYGYFAIENEGDRQRSFYVNETGPTVYAIGGAVAFDKVKWDMLGGFDPLFAPFCWEDIDISYRALKRGWKVLYEPGSEVIHKHHGTLSKVIKSGYKRRIEQRNEMLFTWKNLHDNDMLIKHFLLLPAHILYRLFIRNDIGFVIAFWKAAVKLLPVLRQRLKSKKESFVSDRKVIEEVRFFYSQWPIKHREKSMRA